MPPKILDPYITWPIEREYEAWVIHGIEDYFLRRGTSCRVFAISPVIETVFPADEVVWVNGKVVGLQFKQALGRLPMAFDRLRWRFSSPPGQFELIAAIPDIWYCLPTFVNREWKSDAVHHSLFWRPDAKVMDYNGWYDNPRARTPYNNLANSYRWGRFCELIVKCSVGLKLGDKPKDTFSAWVRQLITGQTNQARVVAPELKSKAGAEKDNSGLYAVLLPGNAIV